MKRKIIVIAIVVFVEFIVPAAVLGWMWSHGFELSFKSYMDQLVYIHQYPVNPIASLLTSIGLKTGAAFVTASFIMTFVELAIVVAVIWLLIPIYREGRAIITAEWKKE